MPLTDKLPKVSYMHQLLTNIAPIPLLRQPIQFIKLPHLPIRKPFPIPIHTHNPPGIRGLKAAFDICVFVDLQVIVYPEKVQVLGVDSVIGCGVGIDHAVPEAEERSAFVCP